MKASNTPAGVKACKFKLTQLTSHWMREDVDMKNESKKRKAAETLRSQEFSISDALQCSSADTFNLALVEFFAANDIAPHTVDSQSLRALIRAARVLPESYVFPDRRLFGCHDRKLGRILQQAADIARSDREQLLVNVESFGGTIMSDGVKNMKRSLINSTLMTSRGDFHIQCTDTKGAFKNAEYLKEDLKTAVINIGPKSVIVIVLDGACKATLKLINAAVLGGRDEIFAKIFGVRCALHGGN